MNTLSTDLTTHIVLTYNGARYFITSEQEQKLRNMDDKGLVDLNGSLIKVSAISEVMSFETWKGTGDYQKYLDSQPEKRNEFVSQPLNWNKEKHNKAMLRIIGGFERYWENRQMTDLAKDFYKHLLTKVI
jgi:hypothetical protein